MSWDVELLPADGRASFGSPEEVTGRILQIYPSLDFVSRQHEAMRKGLTRVMDELQSKHQADFTKDDVRWMEMCRDYEVLTTTLTREDYHVEMTLPVENE